MDTANYTTGRMATTEVHAGGNLFFVTYREQLELAAGGRATLSFAIDQEMSILDDELSAFAPKEGRWSRTVDRVNCEFDGLDLRGKEVIDGRLVFHVWRRHTGREESRVFERC